MCKGTKVALLSALGVIAAFMFGCGGPPPNSEKNPANNPFKDLNEQPTLDPSKVPMQQFFPLKDGAVYTYEQYYDRHKVLVTATHKLLPAPRTGVELAIVAANSTGKKTDSGTNVYEWVPGEGLMLKVPTNAARRIIPAVWKADAHWESEFKQTISGKEYNGRMYGSVVGVERVSTGLGAYDAIHTKIEARIPADSPRAITQTWNYWFVKDIGLVKILRTTTTGGDLSLVLVKKS
jgi:hypothetical protein